MRGPPGQAAVAIRPKKDNIMESGGETVGLELTADSSYVGTGTTSDTLAIADDPPLVWLENIGASGEEGEISYLTVKRSGGNPSESIQVVVQFGPADKSNKATFDDYTVEGQTLSGVGNVMVTMPAADPNTGAMLTIARRADNSLESSEWLNATILDNTNYMPDGIAPHSASLDFEIVDDPVIVSVAQSTNAAEAGLINGGFVFTRSGGDSKEPLAISYNMAGSATANIDYELVPEWIVVPFAATVLAFPANGLTAVLLLRPKSDNIVEHPNEIVEVAVAVGMSYVGGGTSSMAEIVDDPPVVSITSFTATVHEGKSGHITIQRSGGDISSALPVVLGLSGNAVWGDDYALGEVTSGGQGTINVTFPAGEPTRNLSLSSEVDSKVEGEENTVLSIVDQSTESPGYIAVNAPAEISIMDIDIYLAWTPNENEDPQRFVVSLVDGAAVPVATTSTTGTLGIAGLVIDWGEELGIPPDDGSRTYFFIEGKHTVEIVSFRDGSVVNTTFDVDIGGAVHADTVLVGTDDVPDYVEITWESVPGAIGYDISRSDAEYSDIWMPLGSTAVASYKDVSTVPGQDYAYRIVYHLADGSFDEFTAAFTAAPPPGGGAGGGAAAPSIIYSRSGLATPADDPAAIEMATTKGKAEAMKAGYIFVGPYDIRVSKQLIRVPGVGQVEQLTTLGPSTVLGTPAKYGTGGLLYSNSYDGAVALLKKKAAAQRAPVNAAGADAFATTLQDGTTWTVSKDGEWGKYEIKRPAEPAVTIRIETRAIRGLEFEYLGMNKIGVIEGMNNEIDRVEGLSRIIEEKNAKGLLKEPLKADPTNPRGEQEWANKHVYVEMLNRIKNLQKADAIRKSNDPNPLKAYHGPDNLPSVAEMKSIKNVRFEIEGNWQELKDAVMFRIAALNTTSAADGYKFTVVFSASPFVP